MISLKTVETPEADVQEQPVIAAIGTFDGVHLGHRQLFETALKIKAGTGLPVMAVAFHPHPKSLVKPGNDYETLITPIEEKQALLEDIGLDYFWSIHFTREMSQLSPREFTRTYLRNQVRADHVVCGFDFTFGYRAQGNPEVLKQIGREMGFSVSVVPPYTIDGEVASSTKVRRLLSEGNVERAAAFLGRPYCIYGKILREERGDSQTGGPVFQMCFPADKFLPKEGVYAVWARAGLNLSPALANLRTGSASREGKTVLEVHVPGLTRPAGTKSMQLFFVKHIREERRFESRELAEKQTRTDVASVLAAFGSQGTDSGDRGLFTRISAYDRILSADIP